jgi:hypothetical protein
MGLYDEITIQFNVSHWIPALPVLDNEFKAVTYQTKDLECLLNHYKITPSGLFIDIGSAFDEVESNAVELSKVNYTLYDGTAINLYYTGTIRFYSHLENSEYSWAEFIAVFQNSHMKHLYCLELVKRKVSPNE